MKITFVVATDGDAIWIHAALDEFVMDENERALEDSLADARKLHGADNVRMFEANLTGGYEKLEKLFETPNLGELT